MNCPSDLPGEAHAATRDRLLDAAEQLFARQGSAATSLRQVTYEANANLAAVHYHFGSRAELVKAVFARRVQPMNAERIRLLDACEAAAPESGPALEDIFTALLSPALRLGERSEDGGFTFMQLMGRAHMEAGEELRPLIASLFHEVLGRFSAALSRALPGVPQEVILWRMRFALGAMAFAMIHGSRMGAGHPDDSGSCCDGPVLDHLIPFVVAGFRSNAVDPDAGGAS
ncbi:MAG: TetR/AcrR family transcriptional regulator [Gemmatimonadota bacterium]|nr:TetR/AcrR family transcriptional regulator [Gemmatimonadota bacterium]